MGIEITGSVFKRSPEEFKEILGICKEYGISYSPSILKKDSTSLRESIGYVQENYGDSFLLPLIVSKGKKHLVKVLPYLDEKGCLDVVKDSASILSLKFEEIIERERFIESVGEQIVVDGRFNSIYGLSRNRYEEKKKTYNNVSEIKK